mgnify:CR=1 FL=1
MKYCEMSKEQLQQELAVLQKEFEDLKARGLKLNMARGKPGKEQLDIVSDLLTILADPAECVDSGIDCRNYGELSGIPCAKKYFAELLDVKEEEVYVGGNASLTLMFDTITKAYTHGLLHSERPWCKEEKVKWLCPAPGYDRHFAITGCYGFEMITIPMTADGPDMDMVEELVKDPTVKGIWCVPKYSNPDGIIYSTETINRIANLKPAAPDFLVMWDNAYIIHEFEGEYVPFPDMISLCREAGNPDMVFEFASTSKVTLPGAGVAVMASSKENIKYMESILTVQTIGYDKLNQLRHVKYLKDKAHTLELMKKHADVLRPKFHAVLDALDSEIAPLGIAEWKRPKGGYFVSLNAMPGTAKRTLALAKEAGVVMTGAGATFPYGKDPQDSNIRIAPSLPPVEELKVAISVLCTCLRLAAVEKLLAD